MKESKKRISVILGMLVFALICVAGVNAKAYSDPGLFKVATVTGGVKVTAYFGAEDTLSIPSSIGGKLVVGIGSNFISAANRSAIEKVVIPNTVTSVDANAFSGCTNLTAVTFGSKMQSIGASAFEGCEKLSSINFPTSLRTIGTKAFYGCHFEKIVLPGTVESVGIQAFANMKSLMEFHFGNGTKTIGNQIFSNCPNLNLIEIPSSVTNIGAVLVPGKDTTLKIWKDSYAQKYISDNNLDNKVIYQDQVTPALFRFKAKEKTNRKYTFYVGESVDLSSLLEVSGNNTNAILWSSSQTGVFTVDNYGKITAKGKGTATLVAKALVNPTKTNNYTKKTSVNITVKAAPSKIAIIGECVMKGANVSYVKTAAKSSHKLSTGKTMVLAARTYSADGAPVSFSSSNKKVSISNVKQAHAGKYNYTICTVTGLSEGSVDITARSYNGKKMVYSLSVEKYRKQAAGNWGMKSSYTVAAGNTYGTSLKTLKGMPKDVKFISTNTSIATVNASTGVVTGKRPGIVTIRAYRDTASGSEKAETKFTVVPARVKITSVNAGSNHKVTVKWKKQTGAAGYRIAYRKGSGKWKYKYVSSSKSSYTTGKLSKGKSYSFVVRAYIKNNGKRVYGDGSVKKTVKAK